MFVNRIFIKIAVLNLALVLTGCGVDPPRWDLCRTENKSPTASQPIPTTDNLVVYLDTSASMAGYVSPNGKTAFAASPDGSTIFSKTLLELRNVVTTMSPQPQTVIRRVDANISAPSFSDLDLSQASINRSFYNGRETNLAGAIKSFSEPLDKDAEDKAPPRFHILVTDGVQSSDKNNPNLNCAQGSDSFCVKKHLLELINNGWGGAILGLRSEFQGKLYSEVANSIVPFSSGKDASKFRPFYLYIFSPDRAALDKLVDSLRQKLAPPGKEDALREYALTTDYTSGAATIEINQDKQTKEMLEIRPEKVKDGENPRLTVKADLDTASKGEQDFLMTVKPVWTAHALAAGSPDELAQMLRWDLILIDGDKEKDKLRYPNFKLVKQEFKNGSAELTFKTGWTKEPGTRAWRMYRLVGRLDADKTAPPWVRAWSTDMDTTTETANRTLNLESSLANLWNNAALKNYAVADVCARVGEK